MTAVLIVTIAVLVVVVHRQRRQFQVYRLPPVYEEPPQLLPTVIGLDKLERDREKAAQQEQERQLAEADIERWEAYKITLVKLLEAIDEELEVTTDPHKRTALLSRQVTTEGKVHTLDRKIEKAYYTAHKAA